MLSLHSTNMACHVKRIPLCEAEFTEVDTIHAALAQRGFNVEIRPRGNDVTSVCIRTGETRKEVYCKDCKFEVHIGHKDNSTAKPEDSVVVQGTKGWKRVTGVENSGIPMIDEIERLLRKQGSPVLDDAETTIPRVTEERPSRRNDAFWGQARPMPTAAGRNTVTHQQISVSHCSQSGRQFTILSRRRSFVELARASYSLRCLP